MKTKLNRKKYISRNRKLKKTKRRLIRGGGGELSKAKRNNSGDSSASAAPATLNISDKMIEDHLTCPITKERFIDPVIADDGNTYDRSSINSLFRRQLQEGNDTTSPITREKISTRVVPNRVVRNLIGEANRERGESELEPTNATDIVSMPDSDSVERNTSVSDSLRDSLLLGSFSDSDTDSVGSFWGTSILERIRELDRQIIELEEERSGVAFDIIGDILELSRRREALARAWSNRNE